MLNMSTDGFGDDDELQQEVRRADSCKVPRLCLSLRVGRQFVMKNVESTSVVRTEIPGRMGGREKEQLSQVWTFLHRIAML